MNGTNIHGACRSGTIRGNVHLRLWSALVPIFLETTDLPFWRHGEWLHLCSIALFAEPFAYQRIYIAMTAIRHAGGFAASDPNIREDLWQDEHLLRLCLRQALQLADVAKLSEEEWRLISGKHRTIGIYVLWQKKEIAMLLVTKGAEGVVVCYRGQVHHFAGNVCELCR